MDQSLPTLSRYYPPQTIYFYAFPAGEDSNFFNAVPAWKEELVAARPLVCAGDSVRVVTFASSIDERMRYILTNECGVSLIDPRHMIVLPTGITAQVYGKARNARVKSALRRLTVAHSLAMAQPYLDPLLEDRYQIPPEISIALNDKMERSQYIPAAYLPKEYERFSNGKAFANDARSFPFPSVVKLALSSSGDGVRICRTEADYTRAKKDFHDRRGGIFVEEYIQAVHNLGMQFGIPHDRMSPIEFIGYNEQLTTEDGGYLGGVVRPNQTLPVVQRIADVLVQKILPRVRARGWHGIAGLDVLVRRDGRFYFIDPNFRMTAAFPFVFLSRVRRITKSLVSFTGMFRGTEDDFRRVVIPLAREGGKEQKITMIALMQRKDTYLFHAGMLFDTAEDMHRCAQELIRLGIKSVVLQSLQRTFFTTASA